LPDIQASQPALAVIMSRPSDTSFRARRSVIEAAAEAAGWAVRFPWFDEGDSDLQAFIAPFREAAHILADLSDERPSCYYELGLVEALGFPVTLCAQAGSKIHQTSLAGQVHFYNKPDALGALVRAVLAGLDRDDS
jgi:hypothetical protein